jgi:putative transposase
MVKIVTNRGCVYQTAYHIVWCPKYRHNILTGIVADEVASMLDQICIKHNWLVISKEIQPDHVHLFISIPPVVSISSAVKILKGTTARWLFAKFPVIKKRLWGGNFWSPSYYVGTAGNISAEIIQRYIERSEHINTRK